MDTFRDFVSGPDAHPAVDELFASYRAALVEGSTESAGPNVSEFLRARGVPVPATGRLFVMFTEADAGIEPMRPFPECPGGYCLPERCPDGVKQCGWICYCP